MEASNVTEAGDTVQTADHVCPTKVSQSCAVELIETQWLSQWVILEDLRQELIIILVFN